MFHLWRAFPHNSLGCITGSAVGRPPLTHSSEHQGEVWQHSKYVMDGDVISYMYISQRNISQRWKVLVNSYWWSLRCICLFGDVGLWVIIPVLLSVNLSKPACCRLHTHTRQHHGKGSCSRVVADLLVTNKPQVVVVVVGRRRVGRAAGGSGVLVVMHWVSANYDAGLDRRRMRMMLKVRRFGRGEIGGWTTVANQVEVLSYWRWYV